MMNYAFTLICCCCLLLSCRSGETPESLSSTIENLKLEMGKTPKPSDDQLQQLLEHYQRFIAHFPEESVTPGYLLEASKLTRSLRDFEQSISLYDRILSEYPEAPEAADALFMKAFIIDDNMKKPEEARPLYEAFLAKYPDDDMAQSAEFLLKNLGKSGEEILEELKKSE